MTEMANKKGVFSQWLLLFLIVPIFTFYCLIIAGCISNSPGVSQLYLLSLVDGPEFQIRVGYFGICVVTPTDTICGPTGSITKMLSTASSNGTDVTASNTIQLSLWRRADDSNTTTTTTNPTTGSDLSDIVKTIQGKILPPVIVFAGAFFLVAIILRLTLRLRDGRDSQSNFGRIITIYRLFVGLVALSTGLVFGAAIASSEAVASMSFILSQGAVEEKFAIEAGTNLIGLQWATFAIQTLFATWMTAEVLKVHGNFA